jgi:hypothetical protein
MIDKNKFIFLDRDENDGGCCSLHRHRRRRRITHTHDKKIIESIDPYLLVGTDLLPYPYPSEYGSSVHTKISHLSK